MEDYLHCFVVDHLQQWARFLPMAEWHYNTAWHSAIHITPYEVIYGRTPPSLIDYLNGTSSVGAIDEFLTDRTQLLHTLKENLHSVQNRMHNQTNSKCTDITFQLDDWIFLKFQPFHETSISRCQHQKLFKRFFRPFKIIETIGPLHTALSSR